ncbi:MAG TPA: hypothetical protein GXZ93_00330 [Actinobacteria bacterium]|jgi:protein arginine kinase|nr:hypothetical protein [Actinomycetota bacterium]
MEDKNIDLKNLTDTVCRHGSPPRQDIVLYSSAYIYRNVSGYKFNEANDRTEKENILFQIQEAKNSIRFLNNFKFYYVRDIPRIHRQLLMDKRLISSSMIQKIAGKGIIIQSEPADNKKLIAIIINEDEHLKIQCHMPGIKVRQCYKEIIKIEKKLEKKLSFSFSQNLGYLTSNPSVLGTGLKVEILVHLPSLVISTKIIDFIKNLNQTGYGVSSYIAESNEIIGNLFRISNLATLGKNEESIIEELNAIAHNIIEEENKAKKEIGSNINFIIEDSVYRSFGMIKYAKVLSFEEAVELLSIIKFGMDLRIIDEVRYFDFYRLIEMITDSNIELNHIKNKKASMDEIDFVRACVVRDEILKNSNADPESADFGKVDQGDTNV